jgi:hypothetical protein
MRLFEHPRGKVKAAGAEEAAEELYAYSRIDLNAEILPEDGLRCRPSINANFKFTKTAIILQWLQKMENHRSNASAAAILEQFNRLTFSGFDHETVKSFVVQLGKLMELTDAINKLMTNETVSEDEAIRAGLSIAKRWFETALDDEHLVTRATVMHGPEMVHIIHEEMKRIGEMVGNAVFGGGNL